jgi:hypothetical protein
MLAGAFTAVLGASSGCCRCPPPPLLRPVLAWSPMRQHPCFAPGDHGALFGHHGTCWAPWPAEWVSCPEQSHVMMPQADDFIPPPIPNEGFEGPADGEPLPPPGVSGFSPPQREEQAGWVEYQSGTELGPDASARRSAFLR